MERADRRAGGGAPTKPRSYLVNGGLATGTMFFAWNLSRSGRTAIDWIVLALLALAILWNVLGLGRRLYRSGRGRALWHMLRTLTFWTVGLHNTALIRAEDAGSWKHVLGWVLLVTACADSVALYRMEQSTPPPGSAGDAAPGPSDPINR